VGRGLRKPYKKKDGKGEKRTQSQKDEVPYTQQGGLRPIAVGDEVEGKGPNRKKPKHKSQFARRAIQKGEKWFIHASRSNIKNSTGGFLGKIRGIWGDEKRGKHNEKRKKVKKKFLKKSDRWARTCTAAERKKKKKKKNFSTSLGPGSESE